MENALKLRDEQFDILNHHKTLPLGGSWPKEEGEKIPKINNNTLKFKDLLWLKDYNYYNTVASFKYRAVIDFDNGWYVSIINGDHTFADHDEYEMAIFDADGQMINPFGYLTYLSDTDEWMGEVLERLDPEGVEEYLLKASKADFDDGTCVAV